MATPDYIKPPTNENPGKAYRPYWANEEDAIEPMPMPGHVPPVQELGITSAPLKSASFAMGTFCKEYTDDYMLCKAESADPGHCLKEGRRVTRCASDFIIQMKKTCAEVFEQHWQCLERQNHYLYRCRPIETRLNDCIFENMGIKKEIFSSPENRPQVHERPNSVWPAWEK